MEPGKHGTLFASVFFLGSSSSELSCLFSTTYTLHLASSNNIHISSSIISQQKKCFFWNFKYIRFIFLIIMTFEDRRKEDAVTVLHSILVWRKNSLWQTYAIERPSSSMVWLRLWFFGGETRIQSELHDGTWYMVTLASTSIILVLVLVLVRYYFYSSLLLCALYMYKSNIYLQKNHYDYDIFDIWKYYCYCYCYSYCASPHTSQQSVFHV